MVAPAGPRPGRGNSYPGAPGIAAPSYGTPPSVGQQVVDGLSNFFGGLFGDTTPHPPGHPQATRIPAGVHNHHVGPLQDDKVGSVRSGPSAQHPITRGVDSLAPAGADPTGTRLHDGERGMQQRDVAPYVCDKEDLLDQHVAYYLRHHPEVHQRRSLVRKRPGVYELDGREVNVEWQYATEPGGQGYLVVVDGPLRQPFSDYMECTEDNAQYDNCTIAESSSLHMVSRDKRISFGDEHKVYTRLEAMKVAKEQALVRERAAECVRDGRLVPQDLMTQYEKTIKVKLGPGRRQQQPPPSAGPPKTEAAPAAAQQAAAPAAPAAPAYEQSQPAKSSPPQASLPAPPLTVNASASQSYAPPTYTAAPAGGGSQSYQPPAAYAAQSYSPSSLQGAGLTVTFPWSVEVQTTPRSGAQIPQGQTAGPSMTPLGTSNVFGSPTLTGQIFGSGFGCGGQLGAGVQGPRPVRAGGYA